MTREQCPICGHASDILGEKVSQFLNRSFQLRRCSSCLYAFIGDPCLDYARLYDEAYYRGQGADPMVDYVAELEAATTIRDYEWRGFLNIVSHVAAPIAGKKWLDFACGNGGLVRAGRSRGLDVVGFEEGWIADHARAAGIPILTRDELNGQAGQFDVITAIEVIEHVAEPLEVFRLIRRLLKPGGIFYAMTNSAVPFRDSMLTWRYVRPEIHIGFFEPENLALALRATGFDVKWPGFLEPYADVIRFRVLKNIGAKAPAAWHSLVPWSVLAPIVDQRYGVSSLPTGVAT